MFWGKSPSRYLLTVIVMLLIILQSEASIHSRRRGLKTAGYTDDEINEIMKDHDPEHIMRREKHKEELKDHPEVQRYREWRQMQKEGHPEAGAAFVGKIPHDFIPHLIDKHDHKKEEL